MPADDALRGYEDLLGSLAPCAYARIFASSGDFSAAHDALEPALVEAYATYERQWSGRPAAEARAALVPLVAEIAAKRVAPAESVPAPVASSFGRSPKLRALEDAVGVLRSFPPQEQAALFLLHVEDVPELKARAWLGVDEVFL